MSELYYASTSTSDVPKPKSVFINQLDGGYTLNLQGNNFYPVKVCVTIEEVKDIINQFFSEAEVQTPAGTEAVEAAPEQAPEQTAEKLVF